MDLLLIVDTRDSDVPEFVLVPDTEDICGYLFTHTRRVGRQVMLDQIDEVNRASARGHNFMYFPVPDMDTLDTRNERFRNDEFKAINVKAARLADCSTVRNTDVMTVITHAAAIGGTITKQVVTAG